MKSLIKILIRIFSKKYLLASVIFIIWLILFDGNNLIDRISALRKLHQLERDKKYYTEKIKSDLKKLEELKTNNDNLEKFAREQYLMKKDNEEIFIIIDKNKEN
ncbi:MAG: septum formation initiator family protein [Bacteroidetes bacterium]|nr:septum formation initiator family protein [Bacteroidota bacterium]